MDNLNKAELFTQYYQEIYRDLYCFALYILKNPHDAEDVVGEAITDAYASFSKLRDQKAFRSWMFAIVANKCKRQMKEYAQKTEELPEEIPSHDNVEECIQVREAFEKLGEKEQFLVSLKVFGGYNSREIGKMMEMNETTVRSRISRSLRSMRQWLK